MFAELEQAPAGTEVALADILDAVRFDDRGLVPAVAQDHGTGTVLMLAWMDRVALERTLDEGRVWYYSRSRATYWRKGECSGHTQRLVALHFDCDGDTLLLQVEQTGPACHTNRRSCFYLTVHGDRVRVVDTAGEG